MIGTKRSIPASVLKSTLLGAVAFLISGAIASRVIFLVDNYLLALFIAGSIGGLLLGIFLGMRRQMARMATAGLTGMPIGFLVSVALVRVVGMAFPSFVPFVENTMLPDVLLGMTFGAFSGFLLYGGTKKIILFTGVCSFVMIPSWILTTQLHASIWLQNQLLPWSEILGKIDFDLLVLVISIGIGMGLSIGLVRHMKKESI